MSSISSATGLSDGLSQLKQLFGTADKDKNGSLSQTEFSSAVQGISGLSGTNPATLFSQMDANRDGQLSSTELSAGLKLAQTVQDALTKAQDILSGSTFMDVIGNKKPSGTDAQANDLFGSSQTSDASTGSGSVNSLIQQLIANYNTGAATPATSAKSA